MGTAGDIPIITSRRALPEPDEQPGDLVWLVDGQEVDFGEGEDLRPWLEQSSDWSSFDPDGSDDDAVGAAGETLIWI